MWLPILRSGTAAFVGSVALVNFGYKRRWELVCGTLLAISLTITHDDIALVLLRILMSTHAAALPFDTMIPAAIVAIVTAVCPLLASPSSLSSPPLMPTLDLALVAMMVLVLLWRYSSRPYNIRAFDWEWVFVLLCWTAGSLLETHIEPGWSLCGWILLWTSLTLVSSIPAAATIAEDVEQPCLMLNGGKCLLNERVYRVEQNEAGAWFHTLPLYESLRPQDDPRRRFFCWKNEAAMFAPMDADEKICRCSGLLPAELLIYLESHLWLQEPLFVGSKFDSRTMRELRNALVAMAQGMKGAVSQIRYVLQMGFTDAQLRQLLAGARLHTREWISCHPDLLQVVSQSDELSVYTRRDLRVFCMHAEQRTTLVDEPAAQRELIPLQTCPERTAWRECLDRSPTVWDALAHFARHSAINISWVVCARNHLALCRTLYTRTLLAPSGELEPFASMPLHQWVEFCCDNPDDASLQKRCVRVLLMVYYAWRAKPRSILVWLLRSSPELAVALEHDVHMYLTRLCAPAASLQIDDGPLESATVEVQVFQALWGRFCHGVYGWIFESCPEWVHDEKLDPDRADALRALMLSLIGKHVPAAVDPTAPLLWLCYLWLAFIIEFSLGREMEQTLSLAACPMPTFGLSPNRPLAHVNDMQTRQPLLAPWVRLLSDLAFETLQNVH